MTSFVSKKIKGESFGEMLKHRREHFGLTFPYVARRLQISEKYLRSLEEEDFAKLPPSVYVYGFLKRYAQFLKLDVRMVLRRYKAEYNIAKNLKPAAEQDYFFYQKKSGRFSPFILSPRILKVGGGVLAVLCFFIYLGWELSGFSAPPALELASPQNNERVTTDAVTVMGRTDIGAELVINGQPVFIDPQGNFREEIILSDGLNVIEVIARNKLGKEHRETRNILVNLPQEMVQRDTTAEGGTAVTTDGLDLVVEIQESATWISVETDGTNAFEGTMLPGTAHEFYAQERISITSGKASNTYIIFEGKDWGNLGEPGEVVRDVEFTRDLTREKFEAKKGE